MNTVYKNEGVFTKLVKAPFSIKLKEEELRAFCDSCNIIRRYFFERQDL